MSDLERREINFNKIEENGLEHLSKAAKELTVPQINFFDALSITKQVFLKNYNFNNFVLVWCF